MIKDLCKKYNARLKVIFETGEISTLDNVRRASDIAIYAGADFLLMPSRVEPCGLNQLYAIRYGTIPIVRTTGGLKDTVIDFGDEGGYGIRFINAAAADISVSVTRAVVLFKDTKKMQMLRKRMMGLDFSWDKSAKEYIDLYESLIPKI